MLHKEYSNHSTEYMASALCNGNPIAISMLYDKYAPVLLSVLQKMTGEKELAETALQACFITIWRNRGSYNPAKETICSWLLTIAQETGKKITANKGSGHKNHGQPDYVNDNGLKEENWEKTKLMMEFIIFRAISEAELAKKMRVTLPGVREMIRKEINQLRAIAVV